MWLDLSVLCLYCLLLLMWFSVTYVYACVEQLHDDQFQNVQEILCILLWKASERLLTIKAAGWASTDNDACCFHPSYTKCIHRHTRTTQHLTISWSSFKVNQHLLQLYVCSLLVSNCSLSWAVGDKAVSLWDRGRWGSDGISTKATHVHTHSTCLFMASPKAFILGLPSVSMIPLWLASVWWQFHPVCRSVLTEWWRGPRRRESTFIDLQRSQKKRFVAYSDQQERL